MTRRLPGAHLARRVFNLGLKLKSGLTLFGENVSPQVPNDLFVAHLSIYRFAASYVSGKRVLDVGCGAGYGSAHLRDAGAVAVTGIDIDPRNIRYATRHYPDIAFRAADAQHLPNDLGAFDVAIASNVLEHLENVAPALDALHTMLEASYGRLIMAVPPIVDEASLRANEAIPYHRSNYMVAAWTDLLSRKFARVSAFRHFWRDGVEPDFIDPFPSRLRVDDFRFEETTHEEFRTRPTLTALFVASNG